MANKGKKPRLVAENRYLKTGSAKKSAKKKLATKRKTTPTAKKRGNLLKRFISGLIRFVVTVLWRFFLAWSLGHRHNADLWHWLLHARSKAL